MSSLASYLHTTSRYLDLLAHNGIKTVKEFLQYFPRTYEQRSELFLLNEVDTSGKISQAVKGKITDKKVLPRGKMKVYEVTFVDEQEDIGYITYFNTYYTFKKIEIDQYYIIIGKWKNQYGKIQTNNPEIISSGAFAVSDSSDPSSKSLAYQIQPIYPVYAELMGIKPSRFAKNTRKFMDKLDEIYQEYLPDRFVRTYHLMSVMDTIRNMHYPLSMEAQQQAQYRIFFDRLLRMQLHSMTNKKAYSDAAKMVSWIVNHPIQRGIIKNFVSRLPFELTIAQKRVIKECIEDIHSGTTMMRMLQGDVGSGKTIVAATIAYYCIQQFKGQVVFLAPLAVLAQQHYLSLAKLFLPLWIRVELLAGSLTAKQKRTIKDKIKAWLVHIVVGTHAVLQETVSFPNLVFAVIDEQHKFGVKQRAFLKSQGSPHMLQMSATPIPRSLALAFFGEFDVSVIDELPAGRKHIITKIITNHEFSNIKPRLVTKLQKGQKMFVVTPLIEESEAEMMAQVANVKSSREDINHRLPEFHGKIGLLHGGMKASEKEQIMQDFKTGTYVILVSTTVIEVGVDIPEATVILIRNAERFWLSQLHQLRGRVGRNDLQSYCFLETKKKSGDTYKRLQAMEQSNDGFELAKLDLQYRGSGELLGTRQAGESDLPLEILGDIRFVETVKQAAIELLQKNPDLEWLSGLQQFVNEGIGEVLS